jgi:NAD(P)-dependent dehydrogenase (short-subunit alcohol dehydrogenase family)
MTGREVIVVTGASGAIGGALVTLLREEGLDVVAVAGREGADGCDAVVDVSDEGSVVEFFESLRSEGIRVSGLANVAGVNVRSDALDCSADVFLRNVSVNLLGTFLMCREAARSMIAGGGGSIVNVSSTMAFVGSTRSQSPYAATKGGVNALTTALAVEWADRGVRVNAVAPTFVDTPMNSPVSSDPDKRAAVLASIPLGRLGEPGDVAAAIAWLLGPKSSFVTGDILRVDGGYLSL